MFVLDPHLHSYGFGAGKWLFVQIWTCNKLLGTKFFWNWSPPTPIYPKRMSFHTHLPVLICTFMQSLAKSILALSLPPLMVKTENKSFVHIWIFNVIPGKTIFKLTLPTQRGEVPYMTCTDFDILWNLYQKCFDTSPQPLWSGGWKHEHLCRCGLLI